MFDAKRLLDQFMGAAAGGTAGSGTPFATGSSSTPGTAGGSNVAGIAGGAVAGGLAGLLTGSKSGRKLGKSAVTYGGLALLGGLAYKAWQDWQSGKQAQPQVPDDRAQAVIEMPPAGSPFMPGSGDAAKGVASDEADALSHALLRAMIAATKADGHVDAGEQARIFERIGALDLDAEEKAFVMDELAAPLEIEAVVAGAKSPETAAEIYAASLIAIDPSGAAEKGYLALLASRLKLEPALVEHLHANVERALQ
jgi:uncharacterized membrane protein YebE (DUF533 family)